MVFYGNSSGSSLDPESLEVLRIQTPARKSHLHPPLARKGSTHVPQIIPLRATRVGSRAVIGLLRTVPKLSFDDAWETPDLVTKNSEASPNWVLVAVRHEMVVAASIGGETIGVGCVCHIGVHADWRRQGIGERMVRHTLDTHPAADMTYAITEANNPRADDFWLALNFQLRPQPHFERDILPDSKPRNRSADASSCSQVHRFLEARCPEPKYRAIVASLEAKRAVAFADCSGSRGPSNVVLAGSFGVRGTIELYSAGDEPSECASMLLRDGVEWIGEEGVRRVHAFPGMHQVRAFEAAGFKAMVDEKTFVRQGSP